MLVAHRGHLSMNPKTSQSHGHPLTVAAVIGSFSLALGLVIQVAGLLRGAETALLEAYRRGGFPLEMDLTQPGWRWLVLVVVVFGLAFLVLETPGSARRIMLAGTALVLVAAASPILGLWGLYWNPLVVLVGGAWSAFSATLWAHYHPMPCERGDTLRPGVLIALNSDDEEGAKKEGAREVAKKAARR